MYAISNGLYGALWCTHACIYVPFIMCDHWAPGGGCRAWRCWWCSISVWNNEGMHCLTNASFSSTVQCNWHIALFELLNNCSRNILSRLPCYSTLFFSQPKYLSCMWCTPTLFRVINCIILCVCGGEGSCVCRWVKAVAYVHMHLHFWADIQCKAYCYPVHTS